MTFQAKAEELLERVRAAGTYGRLPLLDETIAALQTAHEEAVVEELESSS